MYSLSKAGIARVRAPVNAALALESATEEVEETERDGGRETENALDAFKMSFFLQTNIQTPSPALVSPDEMW